MDVAEFEQDILKLAFETDVRITTASVAYYLGIPSTQAEPMLEELLERGVLELDSDPEGNLYYRVVEVGGESKEISRLKHERDIGVDGGTGGDDRREETGEALPESSIGEARVDEIGEEAPLSPTSAADGEASGETRSGRSSHGSGATGSVGRRPMVSDRESAPPESSSERHRRDVSGRGREPCRQTERREGSRAERGQGGERNSDRGATTAGVVSRDDSADPFAGVTRKRAAMDASLDSCGSDNVVVQPEARCEPRPLADSSPVLASCADNPPARSNQMIQQRDDYAVVGNLREPRPSGSGQSATALAYPREDRLEKPEHQPGMSLLLSLILCGTGQIYNGEVSKGIMMMVLCFLLWFVLLGWVVHIWSIVDSVVVAERINRQSGNN